MGGAGFEPATLGL